MVFSGNNSPRGVAKKEQSSCRSLQKCDKEQSVKVSICTDSDPIRYKIDIENVKEKELSKTLMSLSIKEKYKELFLDLKRLGITDDRLAISFSDQTTDIGEVSMTTTTPIPSPPSPKNVDLEHLVRQQKSEEIRKNLLSRIQNLKRVSMRLFQVLRRTGFANECLTIVCETFASYEGYQNSLRALLQTSPSSRGADGPSQD